MPPLRRNGNRKTKTTRCSCCDNSNNLSKESLNPHSIKKKSSPSKHSLEARNEKKKKTHAKSSSSDVKTLNKKTEIHNSEAKTVLKESNVKLIQVSNEEVKHTRISTRRKRNGGQKQSPETVTKEEKLKECVVKLIPLQVEAPRGNHAKSDHSSDAKTSAKVPTQPSVSVRKLRSLKHDDRVERINHGMTLNKVPVSNVGIKSTTEKKPKECVVKLVQLKLVDFEHVQATVEKGTKSGKSKQLPQTDAGHSNDTKSSQGSVSLRKLRSKKPVKYADSSFEVTKCEEKTTVKKVPIYKQNTGVEKEIKGDQYEFDSDTEKYKKRKRRNLEDSSLDKYNKTIQNILKNIAAKKKKRKVIFSDVNKKKIITKPVLQNYHKVRNNNNQLKSKTDTVGNKVKRRVTLTKTENVTGNNNSPNKLYVTNKINLASTPKVDVNLLSKNNPTDLKQGLIDFTSVHQEKQDTDLEDMIDSPDATVDHSDNDSEEEYFAPSTSESDKSPKVKILSDIQLKPRRELNLSIASPRMFKDGQPNANSTLLNNVLAPWRFNDINIQRNPHFIALKPSSLPYINQEMVLDYSIIDKLNVTSNSAIPNSPQQECIKSNMKKPLMQATLNDYLKYNEENKENEENTRISLFDSDQFSPIKNGSRISSRCDVAKRRILGEINENVMEHPVTVQNLEESQLNESLNLRKTDEEERYFGFDCVDEEDEENVPVKEKGDGPFRLSINMNDKKYQRKRKVAVKDVEIMAGSDGNSSTSDDDDSDTETGQIKLFEDFHNTQDIFKKQEEKIGAMKKFRNYQNKDFQKQKKRKDIRSKEEEEQAEKWAAAFNSMCEEIEQFPLEIE